MSILLDLQFCHSHSENLINLTNKEIIRLESEMEMEKAMEEDCHIIIQTFRLPKIIWCNEVIKKGKKLGQREVLFFYM